MSLLRSLISIIFVACAYAFIVFGAVKLPPIYEAGITAGVILAAFAVVVWARLFDRPT